LEFFQSKSEKSISAKATIQLISIGRLVELKGFEYAVKSVKILVDKGFDVQYTIVGEGKDKDTLLQLISKLNLTESVFLVGAKSQTDIKILLEENHIFLMSSITDSTNRAEAQGVVVAEAQAMGLPVVAYRSGGVPYTILENKTGFLASEKNIEEFAYHIIKLIENPHLYIDMSVSAKRFAINNFSRDLLAQKFFEL